MTQPKLIGRSFPLGATVSDGGVNFSLFSRTAAGVELLLFDRADEVSPCRVVRIDPITNRTYHYWHVFVPGVRPGQIYGYRVNGQWDSTRGLRFDSNKVLLDPYGLGVVVPRNYSREAAQREGDNAGTAMKSVVVDANAYNWQGDAPLRLPSSRTIIYEMHVRGFTRHPNSKVSDKTWGTYAGLIEKIPYLRQLGITAVELLPVFQFDALDCPPGKVNYWGYAPVSFFAPHQAYSSRQDPLGPLDEFRDMVKALHRAGIEVILDVVLCSEDDDASRAARSRFQSHRGKATTAAPLCVSAGWRTTFTTFSIRTAHGMPTTAVRGTLSMRTIQLSAA